MRIAVLLPCYNEAAAIASVVRDFKTVLPEAVIYVYDNNSTDDTARVATEAGATVRHEFRQGKGNVVRRMFADVDADVYVMADGDGTYHAAATPAMIDKLLAEQLDMVVGCRKEMEEAAYRTGHRFGNRLLTGTVQTLFGTAFTDMLSGFRVFSRRYVKSFPLSCAGFEIETEMSVHALQLQLPTGELCTPYGARMEGSESKLRTYHDGFRILVTIARMLLTERPRLLFGGIAGLFAVTSVVLAGPVFMTWLETGMVPRLPTALLSTGLMLLAAASLGFGWLMDNVTRGRVEAKRLAYLGIPLFHPYR